MDTFLLIMAMLGQTVVAGQTVPERTMEWAFLAAQEEFALDIVGTEQAMADAPPDASCLLRSLGNGDYRHRQWASRELTSRGIGGLRYLLLGQRLGDPEIALRCRNILRVLSQCPDCHGRGIWRDTGASYDVTCLKCGTIGHFFPAEDLKRYDGQD